MKKPIGHPGSWFANWKGEALPCVHKHWTEGSWPEYIDPGFDDRPIWLKFIGELKIQGKVILTTSHPPDVSGVRRRKNYIGIWRIADVRTTNGELRFRFDEPLVRF